MIFLYQGLDLEAHFNKVTKVIANVNLQKNIKLIINNLWHDILKWSLLKYNSPKLNSGREIRSPTPKVLSAETGDTQ